MFSDKLWMKCFVAVVFIADTFSTFFDSVFLYRALVTNFGMFHAVARSWARCLQFA
jgi:hypothetical protein